MEAFLAPLAVGRLPGVGRVMEAKLAELGVATCSDLRALGAEALEARFGRWGRRLHELSQGLDEPRSADRPPHPADFERGHLRQPTCCWTSWSRISAGWPTSTWAGYLRERAQHPDRIARTVVLKLKTADFRTLTRSLTGAEPPTSEDALARTACALRARVDLPAGTRYRLAGVGLSGFAEPDGSAAQDDLFLGPHS